MSIVQIWSRRRYLSAKVTAVVLFVAGFVLCVLCGFEPGWLLLLGLALVVAGMALQVVAATHSSEGRRSANRRYAHEFFWAMTSYVVIVAVIWPQVDHVHALALKVLIALLPIVPTVFVARAMVRHIRGGDELEQRVQLEAAAIAGLVVGLLTFSAGFLQLAGVFPLRGALLLVWPLMCGVWGVALWWARRRYRDQ